MARSLCVARTLAVKRWVYLFQGACEEGKKIRQLNHTFSDYLHDFCRLVLKPQENVNNKLVRYVLETLAEIANTAILMFFENLKLWINFVELVGKSPSYYLCQYLIKGLFIRIFILLRVILVGVSLEVGFLSHNADRLICSFNSNRLNVTDWNSVDGILIFVSLGLFCLVLYCLLLFFVCEKTSILCLCKVCFKPFVFALSDMLCGYVQSSVS